MIGKPKVGIVGAGVVGSAIQRLCGGDAVVYDIKSGVSRNKKTINSCDLAFICVPTPMDSERRCDVSIVEECAGWIECPLIIIRSTVAPGTTDRLRKRLNKRIVYQPEYLGETPAHVFGSLTDREFIVLGGSVEDTSRAADFYKNYYNSCVRFYFCPARVAEVAKYMENAFFAVKVTFVNEFFEIARAHGVDFNVLREVWLADSRISRDHTFVFPDDRGFSGKCLPKDLQAIIQSSLHCGYDPTFLKSVARRNEEFRNKSFSTQNNPDTDQKLPLPISI